MHILKQPTPTTCGQTCVAMLATATVEAVCMAIGTGGPTRTHQLVAGLRAFGLKCGPRLLPLRQVKGLNTRAIAKLTPAKGGGGHWVLWLGSGYIDPMVGLLYGPEEFTQLAARLGYRVTSLLPVSPP